MRGRPRGLARLLFAEFWERFSYFSVLSVFALYVNEHLHVPEGRAASLAGTLAAYPVDALALLLAIVAGDRRATTVRADQPFFTSSQSLSWAARSRSDIFCPDNL